MPELPRTASTVVVGGGIVGAAIAYFLADRGETDVVVLEQGALGCGSTRGGFGGIRHQFADELDVRLSIQSSAFWRDFASFTGSAHDFHPRGYLFLATTQEGLAELREPLPLYERLGVPVEIVDRIGIRDLVPGIRVDDLAGGRYCARDGYGDPLQALAGFASSAVLEGVRFIEGCAVESVLREGDRVVGVRAAGQDIATGRVMLATGAWTAPLAATAGVRVPIWPYRRSILEARSVPVFARIPLTLEWETGFHFRPWGASLQRIAVPNLRPDGSIEREPSVPATFADPAFAPLEVPAALYRWARERAAWRHPLLGAVEFTDAWSCHYEMTPDHHPVVGAVPGVAGLHVAAGFSGHGFMHAPAIGQLAAEEMLDGVATTLDISDLSLARFEKGGSAFTHTVL